VPIGRDGTCIVNAAASLDGGPRVAIGCVDAVPVLRKGYRDVCVVAVLLVRVQPGESRRGLFG
jgi:hypothetical protein